MRTVITTVLALIGGFFAGIVVSEIIGIIGFLMFDSIVGFRFLPVISAVLAAGTAVIVNTRVRRKSAAPSPPGRGWGRS
jgi:fructose-specific phosphotransferase system IIC component